MRTLLRVLLGLILLLSIVRAGIFLTYASVQVRVPYEAHNLEGKMAHLAWRFQAGVRAYPTWQDYPHVSNFYSPGYFALVGWVGRWTGPGLDGIFPVGRYISLGSAVLGSLVVGWFAARRYGRAAGWVGGLLSMGAGPLYGFSVMVRPDTLADLLGIAGFLAALGRGRGTAALGTLLLVAACMTKQTAGIYLVAASAGLIATQRHRRGLVILTAGLGLLAGLILVVQFGVEPNFIPSLLGDSRTPWTLDSWLMMMARTLVVAPELPLLAVVGLGLWLAGPEKIRDKALAALAALALALVVGTAGKLGADLNYFLPLRSVEVLAAAAFWRACTLRPVSRPGVAVLMAATLAGLLGWGINHSLFQIVHAYKYDAAIRSPLGLMMQQIHQQALALARDPDVRMLTDHGLIDVYQGERTAYGDPYLFCVQVESGQFDPSQMRQWIESKSYVRIITRNDLNSPSYHTLDTRLPMTLVEAIRRRYRYDGQAGGYYIYTPR